jgi:hypothetical protein
MKTKFILSVLLLSLAAETKAQVLLNEVYSDPGAGKHEFFELYNTNISSAPESMDNYTLVTFFEISGTPGFYVMDLPNLNVASKGYFVGSSAIPFNYQGVVNSTASDFNWNDAVTLAANNGYLKKWVKKSLNLLDGNPDYDIAPLPVNFNDLFFRRTGVGASYTVFLYKNGVLINAVIFGTGGYASVIPAIVAMPDLNVDMSGTSTDFTIKFSTYGTAKIENVTQDAGSDNGFIRKADGLCDGWDKSSSQVQHTPQQRNGYVTGADGVISVSSAIFRGTAITGSKVQYDVLSAPAESFPVTIQVYNDNGSTITHLDGQDLFIESNTESVVTDGPFNTLFTPFDANVLLIVKSSLGCIDKIIFIPNAVLLPVKLISFTGNINNGKISLEWSLASNEMAGKIDIEESTDGKNFTATSSLSATGKTGTDTYQYSAFIESSRIYYRIRITEKSGVVTYSKIIMLSTEETKPLNIMGSHVTDKLTISFQSQTSQAADVNVLDMGGRVILKQKIQASKGNNVASISLPSSMNNGMYIAALSSDNITSSAKFIKQ